jgi:hypothetical protein
MFWTSGVEVIAPAWTEYPGRVTGTESFGEASVPNA